MLFCFANKKKLELETIYPVYSDVYKAVKLFIGAYNTPISQPEELRAIDNKVIKDHSKDKKFITAYKENEDFRYLVNLDRHIDLMRMFKKDFNNAFSANQFCFSQKFIDKTIFIDSEMNKDIEELQSKVTYCGENTISDPEEYIIDDNYKDKIKVYESYLDIFNKEFKKRFKI